MTKSSKWWCTPYTSSSYVHSSHSGTTLKFHCGSGGVDEHMLFYCLVFVVAASMETQVHTKVCARGSSAAVKGSNWIVAGASRNPEVVNSHIGSHTVWMFKIYIFTKLTSICNCIARLCQFLKYFTTKILQGLNQHSCFCNLVFSIFNSAAFTLCPWTDLTRQCNFWRNYSRNGAKTDNSNALLKSRAEVHWL